MGACGVLCSVVSRYVFDVFWEDERAGKGLAGQLGQPGCCRVPVLPVVDRKLQGTAGLRSLAGTLSRGWDRRAEQRQAWEAVAQQVGGGAAELKESPTPSSAPDPEPQHQRSRAGEGLKGGGDRGPRP